MHTLTNSIPKKKNELDVNATDIELQTGLHLAARNGNEIIMQRLLESNAQLNVVDKEGATPLHRAAGAPNPACLQILIQKGLDVNAKDKNGTKTQ
jgi:ankyrin repeat protein